MKTVNVYEAKSRFSQLLSDVEQGEQVVIARAGKPVAILSAAPYRATPEEVARRFGGLRGRTKVPEDFNTIAAAEIQALFEGADS